LAVPLVLPGQTQPRGFLVVGANPRAPFDAEYRQFMQTLVGLVATAVASADTIEAERRHAEASAELDRSRSQFSALNREVEEVRDDLARVIEGTSDIFISFDDALRIRTLNAAAVGLYREPREDVIGRHLYDVAPRLKESAFAKALEAALVTRQQSAMEHLNVDSQRWFDVRFVPAPRGVAIFAADITERKTAEQALKQANANLEQRVLDRSKELREAMQLLAAVFDRAPGGIAITDAGGGVVRVNPAYAAMLGYAEQDLAGRCFSDLVEPGDYGAATASMERLLAGATTFCETEMRFRRADGNWIWVLSFMSVIEDERRQPRYLVHIAKDITGRRRIEAERRAAQEELNVLYHRLETVREAERLALAREVHDQLGQILSATKIDLRLLEDNILGGSEPMGPDQVVRELRSASWTLDRALILVRQIATELRAPELDGQGLYAAIEWHARDFERRTRISTDVDLGNGLPQPALPASQALLRIFQEALTNVLRHAHATEVRITLELRGKRLLLRVRDNGVGIARGVSRAAGSLGLTGMAERAQLAHGRLLVGPVRQRGTLVSVLVPINGGAAVPAGAGEKEKK
jgi:PAS domain S-box-containing protein